MKWLDGFLAACLTGLVFLAICACTTTSVDVSTTKGRIALRATYQAGCGSLIPAHDAKLITGERFNSYKAECIQLGEDLDKIDSLVAAGKSGDAEALGKTVQSLSQEILKATTPPH